MRCGAVGGWRRHLNRGLGGIFGTTSSLMPFLDRATSGEALQQPPPLVAPIARRAPPETCGEQHAMPCHDAVAGARGASIEAAGSLRTGKGWLFLTARGNNATR
jgi:hypothetical protein